MTNPTTPRRARPASVFAPEGMPWVPLPDLPRGIVRDTLYAVLRAARSISRVTAPDRVLARLGGMSERTLQRGLRMLEGLGLISRERRHGGRVITILFRLAGKKPVHRSANRSESYSPMPSVPSSMRDKTKETAGPPAPPAPMGRSCVPEEIDPWTRRWFGRLIDGIENSPGL
jgi:DNA-binding transcriptional ArsR family regulator